MIEVPTVNRPMSSEAVTVIATVSSEMTPLSTSVLQNSADIPTSFRVRGHAMVPGNGGTAVSCPRRHATQSRQPAPLSPIDALAALLRVPPHPRQ
jgi:hypothetical protein